METPPRPHNPYSVLLVVGLGALMSTLDGSVVNISLPTIVKAFGASMESAEWVVMAYLLVLASLLVSFGRAGDLFGHRRVYLLGFVVFGSASFFCGAARSMPGLIAARAAQALGGSMLQAVSIALVTVAFPAAKRGRAVGLVSLFTYTGLAIGPSLGGWLTGHFGWRSIFYVNLPVAALALSLGVWLLPRSVKRADAKLDLPGSALWAATLVFLLVGLARAQEWGLASARTAAMLAASAALYAVFVRVELRRDKPMLDLRLFLNPAFTGGVVAALMNYLAVSAIAFLTPFALVQALGLETPRAGLLMSSMAVLMAICSPLSGALSDRIGWRAPAVAGMALLAGGEVLLRFAETPASFAIALAVCGFGTGIFISPNTSAVMGATPPERLGTASGVIGTARTAGMVLGVAASGLALAAAGTVEGADAAARLHAFRWGLTPGLVACVIGAAAALLRPA